jgi:PAS domain S-box-containing protein
MTATLDDEVAELRRANAELQRRLDAALAEREEASEHQTATGEVLKVISQSGGELGSVLDTLLEMGARLCRAEQAVVTLRNSQDGLYHYGTSFGYSPEFKELLVGHPVAPGRASLLGRTALEGRVVHIEDAAVDPDYKWAEALRLGRWHTGLGVPLLRDGSVVGILALTRRRVERFSDKQIELIKTFADQAVIAIENARLLAELRESDERYGLVNQAVAEGIYEWDIARNSLWVSSRLTQIFGFEGRDLTAADWNELVHPDDFAGYQAALRDCFKAVTARLDCEYRVRHSDGQHRWIEDRGVPVRDMAGRAVRLVGAVSDISDRKAADQALREALEQQTATAEVLGVINSSPGDLTPVFEVILEKAHTLCGVTCGSLELYDGKYFRAVATIGFSDAFTDLVRQGYAAIDAPDTRALVEGARYAHILDLAETDAVMTRHAVELEGHRTLLCVPLRREGQLLGMIASTRKEVRAFTDKEIALLENFAQQAVIAMENARLITETRGALEQQTATAEVLQVINSSPGDLKPVFDAILEKAHSLCAITYGSLQLYDGEKFRAVAVHNLPEALADQLRQGYSPNPNLPNWCLLEGAPFAQVADMGAIDDPISRSVVEGGIRTLLYVALRRDDVLLGQIVAGRREVHPFAEKEIGLLENFAAQAVIALENARLITETREALDQQTATAEVLGVINSSPGDLAPVFEAILEKAHSLCNSAQGTLELYDGEFFRAVATRDLPEPFAERLRRGLRGSENFAAQPLVAGEPFAHFTDVAKLDHPLAQETAAFGTRVLLSVPLRKGDALFGMIVATRVDGRFSDKQIALLQNFAAQAVIAMENARLITETREALDQQTATAEVLQVINSSPGDLAPVFEAILEKAHSLCGSTHGNLSIFDGEHFRAVATHGLPKPFADLIAQPYPAYPGSLEERLVAGDAFVHIPDVPALGSLPDNPIARAAIEFTAVRTVLLLPLRKDGALLGYLSAHRREVSPFTDKQIALLQNFAAQAVIAIENARLITETREALEQQTATAEVLGVINSSPGDLAPVFDAMLEKAMRLCEAAFGQLDVYEDGDFNTVASRGMPAAWARYRRDNPPKYGPGTQPARLLGGERLIHVVDLKAEEAYANGEPNRRSLVDLGGARSSLMVPLLRDDAVLGFISFYRQEVRPFTAKNRSKKNGFTLNGLFGSGGAA